MTSPMMRIQKIGMKKKAQPQPAIQGPAWATTAVVASVVSMVSFPCSCGPVRTVDSMLAMTVRRRIRPVVTPALLPREHVRSRALLLPAGRDEARLVGDHHEVHPIARVQLRH